MPKRTADYHSWLIKKLVEPREAERYLKVAMEDSPEMFLKALRNVAEAHKMAKVAERAGVNRESLYKTLSEDGNPRYGTLNSILQSLGIELTVKLKIPVTPKSIDAAAQSPIFTTGTTLDSQTATTFTAGFALISGLRATTITTIPRTHDSIPWFLLAKENTPELNSMILGGE